MKKIYMLLMLQCAVFTSFAQKHEPVNPHKDKKEMGGFEVRLKPMPGNYRYEIFKGNKPINMREHNADILMPQGFEKKEDAFKVAAWSIKEQKKTGHFPLMIPPHVAMELGIDILPKPAKRN